MKSKFSAFIKGVSLLSVYLLYSVSAGAQYCTPTYSTQCNNYNMYINSFSTTGGKTTNISNINSACDNTTNSYKYDGSKSHDGIQGTSVGFTVQIGSSYPQGVKIFVDFNIDGDFDDNGEQAWVSSGTIAAGGSVTGSFTIPVDAVPGESRIRVRSSYSTTAFTACQAQSYGECEDYKFIILPSCTADFPKQPADVGVCQYEATTFSATTINAHAFQWQVNSGNGWFDLGNDAVYGGVTTANLQIKGAAISMQGYQYRLVATNTNESCSVDSKPATLTLVPTTFSSVVLAAAPAKEVCVNEEAIIYTSFTNGGVTPQYQWLKNGLTIPGETNATLKIKTLDHGDIIQCRFLSSNQCVPPNNSLGVKFDVVTDLVAEVDLAVNYNGGNSYTFIANPTNGGGEPEFYWFVNGKLLPGETGQSFTSETLAPWDKVTVGMVSSRDCALPKLATSRQATTGVSEVEGVIGKLSLSPNPNKGNFSIQAENIGDGVVGIVVTNAVGQVLYKAEDIAPHGTLQHAVDISGVVTSGVYILHIQNGTQRASIKFNITD